MSDSEFSIEYEPNHRSITINDAIEFTKSTIDYDDFKSREKNYLWWLGSFNSDNGTVFTGSVFTSTLPGRVLLNFKTNMLSGVEKYLNLYGYTITLQSACHFAKVGYNHLINSDQVFLTRNDDYDLCCYMTSLMTSLSIGSSDFFGDYLIQDITEIVREYLGY